MKLAVFLIAVVAYGQSSEIATLTARDELLEIGLMGCGTPVAKLEASQALVELGSAALPDIEQSLDQLSALDENQSYRAWWILKVYAQIRGPQAMAKLLTMRVRAPAMRPVIDAAIAEANALSGYFTEATSVGNTETVFCRLHSPGDALQRFIKTRAPAGASKFAIGYRIESTSDQSMQVKLFDAQANPCGTPFSMRFLRIESGRQPFYRVDPQQNLAAALAQLAACYNSSVTGPPWIVQ